MTFRIIPNSVASGVAKPIWNSVTPAILLIKYETGIRTRNVLKIPCSATKNVFPFPFRYPIIEKLMPMITQSTA